MHLNIYDSEPYRQTRKKHPTTSQEILQSEMNSATTTSRPPPVLMRIDAFNPSTESYEQYHERTHIRFTRLSDPAIPLSAHAILKKSAWLSVEDMDAIILNERLKKSTQ